MGDGAEGLGWVPPHSRDSPSQLRFVAGSLTLDGFDPQHPLRTLPMYRWLKSSVVIVLASGACGRLALAQNDSDDGKLPQRPAYAEIVRADKPVAYWRLEDESGTAELAADQPAWKPVQVVGAVKWREAGPRQAKFPLFDPQNGAASFDEPASIRFEDPGANSPFDFAAGDTITLEAWVSPTKL